MLLQPKLSGWNVHSLLSSLWGATFGQQAVKSPWMLHLPPLGRLANKEIYLPIYIIYFISFAHWCRRTVRQGIEFCWLTLSVLFYVDSARQADCQSSSVAVISSTYAIYNFWPKCNCSTYIIVKIPPPHNP
jgi:hypothetical protein